MTHRTYKSMQGKDVDMVALMTRNETQPAVGNAKMNARGDELGPGGVVVKSRADSSAEYYENNPNAIPQRTTAPVQSTKKSKKA